MTFYDLGYLDGIEGREPLCYPREANRPDYLVGYDDGCRCRDISPVERGKRDAQAGRVNGHFLYSPHLHDPYIRGLKKGRKPVMPKQMIEELSLF